MTSARDELWFTGHRSPVTDLSKPLRVPQSLRAVGELDLLEGAVTSKKLAFTIQSDGFVAGMSGWQIKRNGTAEFNNVTVRGSLVAGTIDVPDVGLPGFHLAITGALGIGGTTATGSDNLFLVSAGGITTVRPEDASSAALTVQNAPGSSRVLVVRDPTDSGDVLQVSDKGGLSIGYGSLEVYNSLDVSGNPVARLGTNSGSGGSGYLKLGSGSAAPDVILYRSAADVLKTDDQLIAVDGLATRAVAGAVSDASFTVTPVSGTLGVDTTNSRFYVRVGTTWKSVALT